jgi:hypothetical protein
MNDVTYQIQRRNQTDTAKTDAWIAKQHITAQQFADVDVHVCLLQAQKIARNTMQHHARYLCTYNRAVLNGFLQKMAFGKSRSKLKEQHARAVFRICAQVNRKLYKQSR